jgi:hypothetical protein
MLMRKWLVLCVVLLFAAPARAQGPIGAPLAPPLTAPAGQPLSAWDGPAPAAPPAAAPAGDYFWGAADALVGWINSANAPPLVTTSPAGTGRNVAGVLGPNTTTLFQGGTNNDGRIGARFEAGYFFGPPSDLGVEAGGMVLESQSTFFNATSNGSPILARPYLNANTGAPSAVLVAFPGAATGSINVQANSGNFMEGHFDATEALVNNSWLRLDGLLGYRFYRYDEGLSVQQSVTVTDPRFQAGVQGVNIDHFATKNVFNGGDFGLRARFAWENLSLTLLTKLAVGNVRSEVTIQGVQVATGPGVAPVVRSGGLLALSSNSGSIVNNTPVVFPEFGATLGWQVTPNFRIRLGYSLFLLSQVAAANAQVDPVLNPNLFPGAAGPAAGTGAFRPAFMNNRTDIWAQTVNLGAEFTF